jgi:hypothetical protein
MSNQQQKLKLPNKYTSSQFTIANAFGNYMPNNYGDFPIHYCLGQGI